MRIIIAIHKCDVYLHTFHVHRIHSALIRLLSAPSITNIGGGEPSINNGDNLSEACASASSASPLQTQFSAPVWKVHPEDLNPAPGATLYTVAVAVITYFTLLSDSTAHWQSAYLFS